MTFISLYFSFDLKFSSLFTISFLFARTEFPERESGRFAAPVR